MCSYLRLIVGVQGLLSKLSTTHPDSLHGKRGSTCLEYYERCSSSWFEMIAELIVCLMIESHRCGSRRFDRYTAGLHQAMVSTECVTV